LLGPPPAPLTVNAREMLQMRTRECKPIITEPAPIEGERKEEWKRKRVKIIRQMLDEERRHVEVKYSIHLAFTFSRVKYHQKLENTMQCM
uniref:NUFIP1 domain-containing protein n=1 Tax=Gongylonema pulchrum TaxID=637853 RepID=A0A183CV68_9BILA